MAMPTLKIWLTPRGCFSQLLEPESSRVTALRELKRLSEAISGDAPQVDSKPRDSFGCVILKASLHKKALGDFTVSRHASLAQAARVHELWRGILEAFGKKPS